MMKSRKFPNIEEAKTYLKSRGILEYGGREGTDAKTYVYALTVGVLEYVVLVSEDGHVCVLGEPRYKRSEE